MERREQISTRQKPKIWTWYVVYCIAMCLIYLILAGAGIVLFVLGITESESGYILIGVIYFVLGLVFFIPFVLAPFLPPRPWSWIYGLVMICLGMTSCCCLPITIPLLIYWIKPETKKYFGRE